ncbi:CHAD domain-containing protein [Azomonas macrocytogenes]|uniref:CHAD domain-containing protein n=1 Tax=Azomonas macrocytogenes TaxID=69962 RepID=A0A839T1U6_AZOMA|nr:CHAD domain-containing protein [Azomonas macrocytogenes]MBB3103078.1 CHAD domain-containing protein [Azomonas macrocytogenes]
MSLQIHACKKTDKEVVRLAGERLLKAAQALEEGSAEGVHGARKRLKETRALLRLVRKPLGRRQFDRENRQLRDLGRHLSEQRDAAALLESWDGLAEHDRRRFGSATMKRVRDRLAERVPQSSNAAQSHTELLETLQHARDDISRLSLKGKGFALFETGVHRTYQDGRRALKNVAHQPSDEILHEWRKRVKDHWYQTRLLQQASPELFKERASQLETLSDWLGDDHDLAVMQALLRDQPALFGATNTRRSIATGITARRNDLYAKALELGDRLYSEKPKALVAHWAELWRSAAKAGKGKTGEKTKSKADTTAESTPDTAAQDTP